MTVLNNNYSLQQTRTGVVFDYVGDTFIEHHLKELYGDNDNDQYVYLKNKDFNAQTLFFLLREKNRSGDLIVPNEPWSNRLVYCHYLRLSDLSAEWVDNFFSQSEEMLKLAPYNNLSDQYHLICFQVVAREIQGDEAERCMQLLLRLGTEHSEEISRQIYILREEGIANNQIRKQEYAIAQLFHMFSRKGHELLQPVNPRKGTGVQMVRYADYYDNRQLNCQKHLEKIKYWMEGEEDAGQVKLIDTLLDICNPLIEKLRKMEREFDTASGVYPVRITEYSGNCIFGYRRNENYVRKRLHAQKEETLRGEALRIVDGSDFTSVYDLLDRYCYRDMDSLGEGIASERIKEALKNKGIKNGKGKEIIEAAYDRFIKEVSSLVVQENLNKQKEEKKREKRHVTVLKNEAGEFLNINDCFQRIFAMTQKSAFHGKPLAEQFSACLVNGDYLNQWDINNIEIAEVDTAFGYPPVKPLQVVMLREYNYLTFNEYDDEEEIKKYLRLLF